STSAASMPVSSATISARPARTSFSDRAMLFSFVVFDAWHRLMYRKNLVRLGAALRQNHHLGGINQSGTEADLESKVARADLSVAEQALGRERDGGGGRVAGVGDVTAHGHVLGQTDLLDHLIDDAHVGLVGDECLDVGRREAGGLDRT